MKRTAPIRILLASCLLTAAASVAHAQSTTPGGAPPPPGMSLAWISHASEASARRNPEFESIINVLQEVGPRPEENSLFFGLPVRYRACAISN
jgi:hypothetical protein